MDPLSKLILVSLALLSLFPATTFDFLTIEKLIFAFKAENH